MLTHQKTDHTDLASSYDKEILLKALKKAPKKIAPLWPLESFVAVNPYLGLTDKPFEDTAQQLSYLAGIQSTLPVSFYLEAIEQGKMDLKDVESALKKKDFASAQDAKTFLKQVKNATPANAVPEKLCTIAGLAPQKKGTDWQVFMTNRISVWAASYFDKGQAQLPVARQNESMFASWKFEAETDKSPSIMGLSDFHSYVKKMPNNYLEATQLALNELDIPENGLDNYLHSLLLNLGGWSSYIAHLDWEHSRYGREGGFLTEFLCILICWEYGIYKSIKDSEFKLQWSKNKHKFSLTEHNNQELLDKLILQEAFDIAAQRKLINKFNKRNSSPEKQLNSPKVQAVFCIDVRSEVYRRNLESVSAEVDTLGFAGFFGFPIKYVKIAHEKGKDHCPVLVPSTHTVNESISDKKAQRRAVKSRIEDYSLTKAWKSFKSSAVSSFGFVSPVGLSYLPKLFTDSFGLTRPVPHPDRKGLSKQLESMKRINLEKDEMTGETSGIPVEDRVKMAKAALTAMSLTDNFARLVLIVGHGSTTVNNPHATGLDCGACAGQSGEANAKVAAAILNDFEVRKNLREHQIDIPDTTFFMACLHDTATDELALFNTAEMPSSHQQDLSQLKEWLTQAGKLARAERALRMQIESGKKLDKAVIGRSKDWAQVRPEWGLAGCSAFVVAPRSLTKELNLEGRSFLHSYEWKIDRGFKVLEAIMTAPMVVTSWINLQYYGSTVDNKHFGSGNKTLHNVTAGLGVLEGYAGDLRTGLPMQSLHDGEKFQHEPLRLSVVINAPKEAVNNILEKHEAVRQLCDNEWIFLMIMNDKGEITSRYNTNLQWKDLAENKAAMKAARKEAIEELV